MKSEGFLHSKVGRRVFLLFISCALIPIVVLSLIAGASVTRQMQERGRERLHQLAKSAGMELFRTVEIVGNELMLIATFIEEDGDASRFVATTRVAENLTRSFRVLELVSRDGVRQPIVGELALPLTSLLDLGLQLPPGEIRLSNHTGVDGVNRVYLGTTLAGGQQGERALIGEISPELLQSLQDVLPEGMQLSILDPGQQPVIASSAMRSALSRQDLLGIRHTTSGQLDWIVDDERQMGSYWSVFFGPHHGSPSWTVVLTEPRVDAFAALRQFGKLLPLSVLLCLAVVVLISMAQIRKSMIPLRKLQQGTERIARRRFDSKVEVDSGDEFESLADSFNTMASNLDRQFRTLTTLAEIDRAILSTVDEDRIVQTILDRITAHYSSDGATVALLDAGADSSMTVQVRWSAGAICDTTDHVTLEAEERWRLAEAASGHLSWQGSEIPSYLRELKTQRVEHCLALPLLVRGRLAGCIALGTHERTDYSEEDLQDLRRLANQAAVALSNARLVDELERTNWETLRALARAVDANSPWTAGHSERVTAMAVKLAQRLGLSEEDVAVIHRGGLLHDIGKIGISSEILDKPTSLTEAEMAVMQSHPTVGARILEPISAYAREIPIVLYHHERFDGKGYPEGLAGDSIPRNARILAVADVFDALISERPYREPWPLDQVLGFIRDGAGTHFDPQIVPEFLKMVDQQTLPLRNREQVENIRELFASHTLVHQ